MVPGPRSRPPAHASLAPCTSAALLFQPRPSWATVLGSDGCDAATAEMGCLLGCGGLPRFARIAKGMMGSRALQLAGLYMNAGLGRVKFGTGGGRHGCGDARGCVVCRSRVVGVGRLAIWPPLFKAYSPKKVASAARSVQRAPRTSGRASPQHEEPEGGEPQVVRATNADGH